MSVYLIETCGACVVSNGRLSWCKMNYSTSKMRLTLRKILQALLTAVLLSFSTLAVLRIAQSHNSNGQHPMQQPVELSRDVVFGPERAPRSVVEENSMTEREDNNVEEDAARNEVDFSQQQATATPKPHTTLDDIFISVKTTKNFHQSRLDVILKTWFTLARDQVQFSFFHGGQREENLLPFQCCCCCCSVDN